MSIWRQVLRAGANVEPGPRISFRGDVLCPLRVCPGKCARNIFHICAVCLFLANSKKKKQIATITVPLMELFVLKW